MLNRKFTERATSRVFSAVSKESRLPSNRFSARIPSSFALFFSWSDPTATYPRGKSPAASVFLAITTTASGCTHLPWQTNLQRCASQFQALPFTHIVSAHRIQAFALVISQHRSTMTAENTFLFTSGKLTHKIAWFQASLKPVESNCCRSAHGFGMQ